MLRYFQKNASDQTFSSTDLAALVGDAVVEGEPHQQVLRWWRRLVVGVTPKLTLGYTHRPFDRPVRRDHHPDPSSNNLHLIKPKLRTNL